MSQLDITKENLDELILNIGKPVLLDFWSPQCPPCGALSPILEQIAREQEDFLVGRVNIEKETELADRYHVVNTPTLLVLENGGSVTGKAVGFRTREEILQLLEKSI